MADDSRKIVDPLDFHPCNTPRGMTYYKLEELTTDQKKQLFDQKLEIVRENQRYLNKHPEVKAVVALVLKAVLKARPKIKLRYFLAKYFAEHFDKIKATIDKYGVHQSSSEFFIDDILSEVQRDQSGSSESSIQSDRSSFLCILKGQSMSYDLLPTQLRKEVEPDVVVICNQIVQEILDYVCRDDIVQQVKMFSGDPYSQQYDSDPILAFPYENYSTPSLSSNDDNGDDEEEAGDDEIDDDDDERQVQMMRR